MIEVAIALAVLLFLALLLLMEAHFIYTGIIKSRYEDHDY